MKLYFAPLEGVTTKLYRNIQHKAFPGADAYYAPFITPGAEDKITTKLMKDILPDENTIPLVPQILCNQPEPFLKFSCKLQEMGYSELNLNLGCPSGTVVSKNRGAGLLRDLDGLDAFLETIFKKCSIHISVKTRIGFSDANCVEELMKIFNRYPISLLIIHPRVREDFYKGVTDMKSFQRMYEMSKNPICYNGDVCTKADYNRIAIAYPKLAGVMIGRGAIQNPALFREIKGGRALSNTELIVFLKEIAAAYFELFQSEVFTMHKMKEIMMSVMLNYPESKKLLKAVKKANKLSAMMEIISTLPEL